MSPTKAPAAKTITAAPVEPEGVEIDEESVDEEEGEAVDPEDDASALNDDDIDFDAIVSKLGIDLRFEARPARTSAGRPPAPETPWEQILAGLKDSPGEDVRVRIFEGAESDKKSKSRSSSMAKAIRTRLFSLVPNEEWDISHRFDPNDTMDAADDGSAVKVSGPAWKVYAMYVRSLTPEQTTDRIAKREAIARRLAEAKLRAA